MRASRAFHLVSDFIIKLVNFIFSFGYPELNDSDGYLPIPLYLFGKLVTFTIGYPLGFIFGVLGAGIVAFINLFRNEKVNDRPLRSKNDQSLVYSKSEKEQSLNMDAIELVNYNKKKEQLTDKINKLEQVLETEIAFLNSFCTVHENHLKQYNDLNASLRSKTYLAENAKKFSHNEINTTLVPNCFLLKLGKMNTSKTTLTPVSQSIPVYVPDEAQRNLAKKECESLNKEIKEFGTVSPNKPIQFNKRESLRSIKDEVKNLHSFVKSVKDDIALSHGIKSYKKYLEQLEPPLFRDNQYKKINYLPICDYSELMFASLMVKQLTKGNEFFKKVPRELTEKIIFHAVSDPSFSEKDAEKISNILTDFFKCKEKPKVIDTSDKTSTLTY
ncbi:MAG: hypothetical protein H0T84_07840 [Tatlockia sp.]|nr:hypothetical protein [Tatlockia sp.]